MGSPARQARSSLAQQSFGWLRKIQDCIMEKEEFESLED
jgi:hypothetical protein